MTAIYWRTAAVLLAYLILGWWIGTWLKLGGSDLWFLRGGLALIGLVGAGYFLWFWRHSVAAGGPVPPPSGLADDIDAFVREALEQLKPAASSQPASLSPLALLYLVGESGSAKTSTVVNSSLHPRLLAGHARQDERVVPTRLANFWYSDQLIFLDAGGFLLSQPQRWIRLVQLFDPNRAVTARSKRQNAPRAAMVCFDCEAFLQPNAGEKVLATARSLSGRLKDLSRALGVSVPVYVVFTKADRIPTFSDYVRPLTKKEASEVLGVTLPLHFLRSRGAYSEEEHRRLSKAFDELFYSLAEKRTDLLARETEPERLPGIYEFPRDLRKLRTHLVDFLVDLMQPGDPQATPFLRGFYFSGMRPVMVEDPAEQTESADTMAAGTAAATRIFGLSSGGSTPVQPQELRMSHDWVFLSRLFRDVILKDRVALGASTSKRGVDLLGNII